MSDMLLLNWLRDGLQRVSLVVEAGDSRGENPQGEAGAPASSQEVERTARDTIAACELFPSLLTQIGRLCWESARSEPGGASNETGERLQSLFDGTLHAMEAVRAFVESKGEWTGRPMDLERLDRALAEARRICSELDSSWLWFTTAADAEARASIARGEGVDVEQAFAQMAGLSVEELRTKMEVHKRRHPPSSNGVR